MRRLIPHTTGSGQWIVLAPRHGKLTKFNFLTQEQALAFIEEEQTRDVPLPPLVDWTVGWDGLMLDPFSGETGATR